MIHYASIQDAWGKKEMFKNNNINIPPEKFTNKCVAEQEVKLNKIAQPPPQPSQYLSNEKFTQNINNQIKNQVKEQMQFFQQQIHNQVQQELGREKKSLNEHFNENKCGFMEHLQNCPQCMNKLKESIKESLYENFADASTSATNDKPISTINLFGLEINITKDVLKVLFIIILAIIFILLLRMVNVSFKKPNDDMVRLMAQMKYFNPTI